MLLSASLTMEAIYKSINSIFNAASLGLSVVVCFIRLTEVSIWSDRERAMHKNLDILLHRIALKLWIKIRPRCLIKLAISSVSSPDFHLYLQVETCRFYF